MPYSVHYLMHYACQDQHQALIRQQHLHEGKTQQTRHLHHRAPGWCWEVQSVQEVGETVVVTGRLTIPTADGDLLHYSAVTSEPLETASKAPPAEVAASSCLRRASALAGLGLELWG